MKATEIPAAVRDMKISCNDKQHNTTSMLTLSLANNSKCSSTVSSSKRMLCWGHTPKLWDRNQLNEFRIIHTPTCFQLTKKKKEIYLRRTTGIFVLMLLPYTKASPDVDGNIPLSMLMVVVLPAPCVLQPHKCKCLRSLGKQMLSYVEIVKCDWLTLWPKRAKIWPSYKSNEISFTATLTWSLASNSLCNLRILPYYIFHVAISWEKGW